MRNDTNNHLSHVREEMGKVEHGLNDNFDIVLSYFIQAYYI